MTKAASTPVGGWGGAVAWRWSDCGIEFVVKGDQPHPHYAEPLYAAPPPPSVSTGSRPQEAVPAEQAETDVLGVPAEICHPRDEKNAQRLLKPYRKFISSTPALLSLLYDADLLPEQIVTVRGAVCTAAVCEGYRAGQLDAISPEQPADGCSSNEGADVECPAFDGSGKIIEEATTTGANQHSACQHDCEGGGRNGPHPSSDGEARMTQPHYIDLKPCPFCGAAMQPCGDPVVSWSHQADGTCIGESYGIWACDPEAIAAWNRRHAPMEAVAWRYRFVTTTDGKSWSDWYYVDSREEVPENPQQILQALAVIPTQGGSRD